MKKTLVLLIFFVATIANAQVVQKITGGAILGTIASTSFDRSEKPFSLGYNLSPNVTIFTSKTYHNVMYGLGNNSLSSLNGYFLNNNWDTYLLYSKTLHTDGNYLGWGIEKMIKVENKGEGVKCFLLSELGTDFSGNTYLSFGLLISVQNRLWKRK